MDEVILHHCVCWVRNSPRAWPQNPGVAQAALKKLREEDLGGAGPLQPRPERGEQPSQPFV